MIQLEALKEQLRLLGHDLPDAQITAILAEMNVEVDTPGLPQPACPGPGPYSTSSTSYATASVPGAASSNYMQYTSAHTTCSVFPNQGASGAAGSRLPPVHEEDDCVVTRLSTEVSDLDFLKACSQPISALSKPAAGVGAANTQPEPTTTTTSYLNSFGMGMSAASSFPASLNNTTGRADIAIGAWADSRSDAYGAGAGINSQYHMPQQAVQAVGGTPPPSTTQGSNGSALRSGARRIPVQDESENESDDDASPLPDAYHSRAGGSGGARAGGGRVATRLYDEEEEDEDWDEVDEVDDILARYYGTAARRTSSSGSRHKGRPASALDTEPVSSQLHGMHLNPGATGAPGVGLGGRLWSAPAGRAGTAAGAGPAAGMGPAASSGIAAGSRGYDSNAGGPENEAVVGGRRVVMPGAYQGTTGGVDSILRRVTGDSVQRPAPRPPKYKWQDDLRGEPSHDGSRTDQGPRPSTAARSVAGSVRSTAAAGQPKKVDRVARYQQLQKSWSKDKFLRNTAVDGSKAVSTGAPKTAAVATARKPLNFHAYFKAMHAAEAADRRGMLQQSRARTQADLAPGAAFVAPNDKRRDALRWETRTRMQQHSRPSWE